MTDFILHSDIIIPEGRIRKTFSDKHIENLAASLYQKGYIHPIALRDDSKTLVSGENRLRAHALLLACGLTPRDCPHGHVPFNKLSDLKDDDILEAELEENILRDDLTWQEEAQAIKDLHTLRQAQNPQDWSFADTANEIVGGEAKGSQRSKVSESIILADHLDDPLIANAPNRKEAIKAIKTKNKHLERKKAVEDFDAFMAQSTDEGETDANPHTLIHGDFFEIAPTLPDKTFGIIITDPPYGIDIHKKGTFDQDEHEYDDSKDYFTEISRELAKQSFRVAAEQAHAYVFCDIRRWPDLVQDFLVAGWDVWPRPLIWDKGNIGSFANADIGPRSTYESILYATKGHKPVQHNDRDVIQVNQSTRTEHPANKPVELYENLLQRSAFPGEQVIDFFCGSGPVFPSAKKHKLIATGIELNDKYHAMAFERYQESK